jgi:hypothetical protein
MSRRLFAALVAAFALIIAPAAAAANSAGHLRYAIGGATQWPDLRLSAERHDVVILHAWQLERLRALKAADPTVHVLLYKDLSAINSLPRDNGYQSTGVAYDEADPAHPEWFLRNTAGQRFHFRHYDWLWAADIGNADYQRRWADNVAAELRAAPWDGVFMDDVNPTMMHHYDVRAVAKYPSDAAYQAATRSALAAITPRLRATGKLVVANMGSWVGYTEVVGDWLQFVGGAMDETFTKWSDQSGANYRDPVEWELQLAQVQELQRRGKLFLAVTQSAPSDRAAARYGFATLLLGADGRAAFQMGSDYNRETWFPEYDYPIGEPLGAAERDSSGVHRRAFANGLVVVNPTRVEQHVRLGGTYSGSDLSRVSAATLAPHSALILYDRAPAPAEASAPAPAPAILPSPPPLPPAAARAARSAPVAVRVRVRCRRSRACRGRIVLRARARGRGSSLGARRFRVRAARSIVVRVRLNRAGRRLVAEAGIRAIKAERSAGRGARVAALR